MAAKSALLDRLALHAPHLPARQYVPAFMYGTAWKKETTEELVHEALNNGFTAIDTACQPKHYREDLVGAGLSRAVQNKTVKRSDVFVQTKFTSVDGQDINNMPYIPDEPLTEQVKTSVETSLRHFDVSKETGEEAYLDSVVMHSPMRSMDETMTVWRTLESYVPNRIRNLGISNVSISVLTDLYKQATIKPSMVQNRFYASTKFDVDIRRFCKDKAIVYQSFWTLSANPQLIRSKPVQNISSYLNISPASALYCLVLGLGNIVILNGTTKNEHMKADWQAISAAKDFAMSNSSAWETEMAAFKSLIRQVDD